MAAGLVLELVELVGQVQKLTMAVETLVDHFDCFGKTADVDHRYAGFFQQVGDRFFCIFDRFFEMGDFFNTGCGCSES